MSQRLAVYKAINAYWHDEMMWEPTEDGNGYPLFDSTALTDRVLAALGSADAPPDVEPMQNVRYMHPMKIPVTREYVDDHSEQFEPAPRVRHPDLQKALDAQAASVAIPPGTKLYCSEGCINGDAVGFTDQMALSSHTKRNHGRAPTAQEMKPR